ncbi:MoxR family ATPase [Vreelandella rituensis]|uniref:AAA family ATPase n=1 Tax=Vreelandella rituensis TaxID=2282306 RepID=A0A368TPF8_9GAMM|nr:MoxR family ATPase [Halomonas rituensis]RCV86514.1 AAA family ATPase [Halomonas rituensis]
MLHATPNDVITLLDHQLRLLNDAPTLANELPPIMLWGPPGVGKSSIVKTVTEQQGIGFIDIRLSQREPVDLRGLPVPDIERGAVDWLLASEWPRDPESRGIILFDELTAADRSLQVAAYELILDRRLGDLYQLPPGWLVVAAGNRSQDRAVAQTFSSALANRFCHLLLEADLESWTRWASGQGLHPDVIAFLRFRPENFFDMSGQVEQGWPSPRSWTRVAQSLSQGMGLADGVLALLVHGLVGSGAGTEFLAFRDWARKLPDIPGMLEGRVAVQIPQRADQRYAFCSSLAHYLWKHARQKAPLNEAQQAKRLSCFYAISRELSSDFATLVLLDAMQGADETATQARTLALMSHADFDAWTQQHGSVFSQHLSHQQQALAQQAEVMDA